MGQNYVWKVEYEMYGEGQGYMSISCVYSCSKIFTNKISALNFLNKLQNNENCKSARLIKWRG